MFHALLFDFDFGFGFWFDWGRHRRSWQYFMSCCFALCVLLCVRELLCSGSAFFGIFFSFFLTRLQTTALTWPARANSYPPSSTSPSFLQSFSTTSPPPA